MFRSIFYGTGPEQLSDPLAGGITSNIPVQGDFKTASLGATPAPIPAMSFHVKPEATAEIISNLDALKGRTDDSEIIQKDSKYSFMDTRNNRPLAEIDTATNKVTLYKSVESLAARINSNFVTAEDIRGFIKEYSVAEQAPATPYKVANNGPS